MQKSLYPLNAKDVEAIGRARATRSLPQNIKWWLYGGLGVCMAGFIYGAMGGKDWVVIGIIAVGALGAWYSTMLVDKIRKGVVSHLKKEWRAEEAQKS